MQELLEWHRKSMRSYSETNKMIEAFIEKEKEQILASVRYGQNNSNENIYEEGELYYNEIYNSDTQFIKSSIPNGVIKIAKNK